MHPELLVRKRIWLMTLVLTGLFLLAAARIAVYQQTCPQYIFYLYQIFSVHRR